MGRVDYTKAFWKTIKEVSVAEIIRESQRSVALAMVGSESERASLLHALYPGDEPETVRPLLRAFSGSTELDGYPQETGSFDIMLSVKSAVSTDSHTSYCIDEIGDWDRARERILDDHPELALALARRFPGFRESVCQRIVHDCAVANAEFAMLNALPGVIPIIGPLLAGGAIADILMLTKNQGMMLFRLAAAHNLPLDARARARDLAPLLGNALGWKAIAREVIGFVPGGFGLVARGAIAYAGTAALGRALTFAYRTGGRPTKSEITRYYRDALGTAKEVSRKIAGSLGGRRRPRLPK